MPSQMVTMVTVTISRCEVLCSRCRQSAFGSPPPSGQNFSNQTRTQTKMAPYRDYMEIGIYARGKDSAYNITHHVYTMK